MKPTILTMWDELASNEGSYISQFLDSFPIILATRLRVTSYNGISLSTKSSTAVLFNPQTPECQALQYWLLQNEEQIKLLQKDTAVSASTMGARTTPPVVIPITSVSEDNKETSFWVKASASINKESQKLWYMCCSTCWRGPCVAAHAGAELMLSTTKNSIAENVVKTALLNQGVTSKYNWTMVWHHYQLQFLEKMLRKYSK
ncbi:replication protein A 70 kDa DNA-binding subunit D-like [Silene latifolia]|uniref:replication protein A 70 kDa DNA-binding subunit D-like n=1 Tax=Silene latifolia TaxID=37657 RepID=UPI003D776A81